MGSLPKPPERKAPGALPGSLGMMDKKESLRACNFLGKVSSVCFSYGSSDLENENPISRE